MPIPSAYRARLHAANQSIAAAVRRIEQAEPRAAVGDLNEAIRHLSILRNWQRQTVERMQQAPYLVVMTKDFPE